MMRHTIILAVFALLVVSPVLGNTKPAQQQPVGDSQIRPVQIRPVQDNKKQQQKFATCGEATQSTPGYTFTTAALKNCPELATLQNDPNVAMTFFVPSDKAVKNMAAYIGLPVTMMASPKFKGIMCNVLKYHMVEGVHLKKNWQVGEKLTTKYNNAHITVSAVGQTPQVTTQTGVQANIKRVTFCGNSVAFGTDAVLTPFKVPKLGRGGPAQ